MDDPAVDPLSTRKVDSSKGADSCGPCSRSIGEGVDWQGSRVCGKQPGSGSSTACWVEQGGAPHASAPGTIVAGQPLPVLVCSFPYCWAGQHPS